VVSGVSDTAVCLRSCIIRVHVSHLTDRQQTRHDDFDYLDSARVPLHELLTPINRAYIDCRATLPGPLHYSTLIIAAAIGLSSCSSATHGRAIKSVRRLRRDRSFDLY